MAVLATKREEWTAAVDYFAKAVSIDSTDVRAGDGPESSTWASGTPAAKASAVMATVEALMVFCRPKLITRDRFDTRHLRIVLRSKMFHALGMFQTTPKF